MCFGGVVVAIDRVLRSLKGKILSRINKSWVHNFPRYESNSSDQNINVVRFFPWKVTIPCFSGANDFIVSCSKWLYKWKSLGACSDSLNINVSLINA